MSLCLLVNIEMPFFLLLENGIVLQSASPLSHYKLNLMRDSGFKHNRSGRGGLPVPSQRVSFQSLLVDLALDLDLDLEPLPIMLVWNT